MESDETLQASPAIYWLRGATDRLADGGKHSDCFLHEVPLRFMKPLHRGCGKR
jgi:hypothetical protein